MIASRMIYLLLSFSLSFCSFVNSSTPSSDSEENNAVFNFLSQRKARLETSQLILTDENNIKFFELLNNAIRYPKSVRNTMGLITSSYPYFKPPPDTIYNESSEYQQEVFQAMRDLYIDCWNTTARFYFKSHTSGFHPVPPTTLNWCVGSTMQQLFNVEPQELLAASKTGFATESSEVSSGSIGLWHNLTTYIFHCIPMEGTHNHKLDDDTKNNMAFIEDQVSQWSEFSFAVDSSKGESFILDTLNFWISHPEDFRKSLRKEHGASEILRDFPFFGTDNGIREFNNTAIYRATTQLLANESRTLLQEGIELLRNTFVEMVNMQRSESKFTSRYDKVRYEFNMSEVTLLEIAKHGGRHWNFQYVHDVNNSRYLLNFDDNGVIGQFVDNSTLPKNRMTERVRKNINSFIKLYWKIMESRGIFPRKWSSQNHAVMCNYKSMAEFMTDQESHVRRGSFLETVMSQVYGEMYGGVLRNLRRTCDHCRHVGNMIDQAISDAHNGSNVSLPLDLTFVPLLEQVRDFVKDAASKYQERAYTLTKQLYEQVWLLEPKSQANRIPDFLFMTGTSNDCKHGENCSSALLQTLQILGQTMDVKYVDKFGHELVLNDGSSGTFKCIAARDIQSIFSGDIFISKRSLCMNMKSLLNDFLTLISKIQKMRRE